MTIPIDVRGFGVVMLLVLFSTIHAEAQVPTAWADRYTGLGANGYDEAKAIVVDKDGNVYVTGQSGTVPSGPACCNGDYVTIKYNAAGVRQWIARYDGTGHAHDVANSLAVDGQGNVYVSGASTGSGSGLDITTLKYGSDGALLWEGRYNGPGNLDDYSYTNSLAVRRDPPHQARLRALRPVLGIPPGQYGNPHAFGNILDRGLGARDECVQGSFASTRGAQRRPKAPSLRDAGPGGSGAAVDRHRMVAV